MAANVWSRSNASRTSPRPKAGEDEMTGKEQPISTGKIEITKRPHIGLYPGTFDPVTLGHLDIVKRAVKLVDHLVIGLATGTGKTPLFSLEERVAMWRHEATPFANGRATIEVVPFENKLQVD